MFVRPVGDKQELRELNWRPHEAFIRALAGGELPLERVMVTPASVARSARLKLLYSNFPARQDEPLYDSSVLTGTWNGDYSIRGLPPATATIVFDDRSKLVSGAITLADGERVTIEDLTVAPFSERREFSARLRDARGILGDVRAGIRDEGRRLVGTWSDDSGYRGVFSMERHDD